MGDRWAARRSATFPALVGLARQPVDWSVFEYLDRLRRLQGASLDALGFGPEVTHSVSALKQPGLELKRYVALPDARVPFLLVPAPIKRSYIFDLCPEVSVVKRCMTADARVFMIEWQPAHAEYGLAQCVGRILLACKEAAGNEPVVLVAHSLGGLLATIFAALHPSRVRALILIAAPLHFGPDAGVFHNAVISTDWQDVPESVPGSYISTVSFQLAPKAFGWERSVDFVRSAVNLETLRNHLRVQRWTLDEYAMPRQLYTDIVQLVVREDRFVGGKLIVGGHAALPCRITAPLLCVVDPLCTIVPRQAVQPFIEAVGTSDTSVFDYGREAGVGLQHVGPLVGRRAHVDLWPSILRWVATR
jgi:polyhydroxyalkanoate synthase